jgi:hypothetical protein
MCNYQHIFIKLFYLSLDILCSLVFSEKLNPERPSGIRQQTPRNLSVEGSLEVLDQGPDSLPC